MLPSLGAPGVLRDSVAASSCSLTERERRIFGTGDGSKTESISICSQLGVIKVSRSTASRTRGGVVAFPDSARGSGATRGSGRGCRNFGGDEPGRRCGSPGGTGRRLMVDSIETLALEPSSLKTLNRGCQIWSAPHQQSFLCLRCICMSLGVFLLLTLDIAIHFTC